MLRNVGVSTVALVFFLLTANGQSVSWTNLADGVEYASFVVKENSDFDSGKLRVVRIDPEKAELVVLLASQNDNKLRTAKQWVEEFNLIVAINAGMYAQDYRTNVGYLRNGEHLNNPKWHPQYKSALAFGPTRQGLPLAMMIDLDSDDDKEKLNDYKVIIQNLRLIKGNSINVWSASDKIWSEAAVAIDKQGRVLFLFCMTPFTMKEFNRILLSLPLDVIKAMHVEGGPEASLSLRAGDVNLDLCGSYETGFIENKTCPAQWRIPNVLGVKRKSN